MSPLWALGHFFGQPHLSLYLFWVLLCTISLLTRLSWAHWRHASYKRRYKIQICQRQKLSKFLNVKKTKMTSEEKKGFKIPTNLIKRNFKNTPNKKGENSKRGKTQTNRVSKKSKVQKEGTTNRIKCQKCNKCWKHLFSTMFKKK